MGIGGESFDGLGLVGARLVAGRFGYANYSVTCNFVGLEAIGVFVQLVQKPLASVDVSPIQPSVPATFPSG